MLDMESSGDTYGSGRDHPLSQIPTLGLRRGTLVQLQCYLQPEALETSLASSLVRILFLIAISAKANGNIPKSALTPQ